MNTGAILLLILVIFVIYLAATNRLDKVWQTITKG